jgi:hypothetical protein
VCGRPGVGRATPVERKKKEGSSRHEKEAADGVDGPEELPFRKLRVDARRWLVDEEETEGSGSVKCGLKVVDVALQVTRKESAAV